MARRASVEGADILGEQDPPVATILPRPVGLADRRRPVEPEASLEQRRYVLSALYTSLRCLTKSTMRRAAATVVSRRSRSSAAVS